MTDITSRQNGALHIDEVRSVLLGTQKQATASPILRRKKQFGVTFVLFEPHPQLGIKNINVRLLPDVNL